MFEHNNALRPSTCAGKTGKLQHRCDVSLIFRPYLLHVIGGGEIVVAIGELKAALQEIWGVVGRVRKARGYPQSKKVIGMKVGVVERVHIRAQALAQRACQLGLVSNGGDLFEHWLDRSQAA